jgi:hypothetical protein
MAALQPQAGFRMASIRIAMAQFDFPVGDVAGNTEKRIIEMIGQARDEYGAELVMFTELAVSGYPPEDLLLRRASCTSASRRWPASPPPAVASPPWSVGRRPPARSGQRAA